MARKLKDRDYVYFWVDGVHFNVRLGDDERLCSLVMVGVRLDGTKELIALTDGYRESTESWAELLRGCKKRGMRAPVVVAVGDGALGFWAALRDVFPETRPQRDWVHKTANVLDCLPKSVQPAAKRAIFEITNAENKDAAQRTVAACAHEFGAKWPKALSPRSWTTGIEPAHRGSPGAPVLKTAARRSSCSRTVLGGSIRAGQRLSGVLGSPAPFGRFPTVPLTKR